MFRREAAPPTEDTLAIAEKLAKMYGILFLPVYLALLCLEPRPWFTSTDTGICEDQQTSEWFLRVLDRTEFYQDLAQLVDEEWLEAETPYFPDIKQWVGLLSALVRAEYDRPVAFRTRGQGIKKRLLSEGYIPFPAVRRFVIAKYVVVNFWSRWKNGKSDRGRWSLRSQ